jgi:hypothetical protein
MTAPRAHRIPVAPAGSRERGQASVELVGLLPLLVVVALAAAQVVAAAATRELAGHAAGAAAIALVADPDGDPRTAARSALPGWSRDRLRVTVADRRVTVRLAPPTLVPGTTDLLTATATADAGPG